MNEARMCQLAALLDREFGKVPGSGPKLRVVRNEPPHNPEMTKLDAAWLAEAAQRIHEENRRVLDDMAAQWLRPADDADMSKHEPQV